MPPSAFRRRSKREDDTDPKTYADARTSSVPYSRALCLYEGGRCAPSAVTTGKVHSWNSWWSPCQLEKPGRQPLDGEPPGMGSDPCRRGAETHENRRDRSEVREALWLLPPTSHPCTTHVKSTRVRGHACSTHKVRSPARSTNFFEFKEKVRTLCTKYCINFSELVCPNPGGRLVGSNLRPR